MTGHRKLGPVLATMIVAGNMVGSGIFFLPATLAGVGSLTILGWLIGTVGALALALLFSKLARRKPLAGGPATYAFDAFGRFWGSQSSLWYWAACLIGNVAIATAASSYLATFFGLDAGPVPGALFTVLLLWLVTVVNMISPRFVGQFDGLLLIVGLIPLLLVVTVGWASFDAAQFSASWNVSGEPLYKALPNSLALVFWAFTGLESASVAAAVVDDPERNVPIATMAGVLIAALLYIGASIAIFGIAPAADIAASGAPFALAAAKMLGPAAGPLVALFGGLKALGTLAGWVLMTAQVSRAAADHGLLPQMFARTRAGDTPVAGLVISGLIGTAAIVITIAPTLGKQFGYLSEASTLFALLTYLGACAAALRYRRMGVRGETGLAVIGAVFCIAVIALSTKPVLKAFLISLGAFAVLYLPLSRRKYRLPDPLVRTGEVAKLRERYDDPETR
ncbi:MAG TPA: amino acid permease [Steroidobacteraceae bacterium]|nr:amino acid permease [Steroidobacteraceae bacterium]